jgi:uncharacterized membrane protein
VLAASLDLAVLSLVALVAAGAVVWEWPGIIRLILGIPFVLFVPGYALAAALFPSRERLDGVERVALGFGLSLATVPIVALSLDRSTWRISGETLAVGLAVTTVGACAAAVARRQAVPEAVVPRPPLARPRIPNPRAWDGSTRIVALFVGLIVVMLLGGGVPIVLERLATERLTEFALYNAEGEASFYPREVRVGEPVEVRLSVANHEGKTVRYRLVVAGAAAAAEDVRPIALQDGETWSGAVRFVVRQPGERIPVLFQLWRDDQPDAAAPYRELRLVVDGIG